MAGIRGAAGPEIGGCSGPGSEGEAEPQTGRVPGRPTEFCISPTYLTRYLAFAYPHISEAAGTYL